MDKAKPCLDEIIVSLILDSQTDGLEGILPHTYYSGLVKVCNGKNVKRAMPVEISQHTTSTALQDVCHPSCHPAILAPFTEEMIEETPRRKLSLTSELPLHDHLSVAKQKLTVTYRKEEDEVDAEPSYEGISRPQVFEAMSHESFKHSFGTRNPDKYSMRLQRLLA
ncbi:hypothetical protein WISP_78451 [Willisornis vidua]|uniref:Uncharacterized protein n=1 Tax=Willisornis vidua TaxID=1566151 RepID=A0ABQ9D5N4_9PASS|nr:hypothetical protein WISP_78451 [Willisornis vidua]